MIISINIETENTYYKIFEAVKKTTILKQGNRLLKGESYFFRRLTRASSASVMMVL